MFYACLFRMLQNSYGKTKQLSCLIAFHHTTVCDSRMLASIHHNGNCMTCIAFIHVLCSDERVHHSTIVHCANLLSRGFPGIIVVLPQLLHVCVAVLTKATSQASSNSQQPSLQAMPSESHPASTQHTQSSTHVKTTTKPPPPPPPHTHALALVSSIFTFLSRYREIVLPWYDRHTSFSFVEVLKFF
jgi:hypothetical protein